MTEKVLNKSDSAGKNVPGHSKTRSEYPCVTITIPTLNNQREIGACLRSVFMQQYPKDRIEVIIVDGGSTDKTLEVCRRFPLKIYVNPKADSPEKAKMLGYSLSRGEIFTFLDADMRLPCRNWLLEMIRPLLQDKEIVASFTRYLVDKNDQPLNRCLSYHPSQCDPFLSFLYPRSGVVFSYQSKSYIKLDFTSQIFPPIGFLVYRSEALHEVLPKDLTVLLDVDLPNKLIKAGYTRFAYVPKVGLFHLHASSLSQLLRKRARNVDNSRGNGFLPNFGQRDFLWFNPHRAADMAKLLVWIIYANLFIPHTFVALCKSLKFRDAACMWEALLAPLVTDTVLITIMRNPRGMKLVLDAILSLARGRTLTTTFSSVEGGFDTGF